MTSRQALISRQLANFGAVLTLLLGLLVLAGWALNNEALKRGSFGLVAMNPATAVSFILLAIGLLLQRADPPRPRRIWFPRLVAALVVAFALARIGADLFGSGFRIDQVLFHQRVLVPEHATHRPNRVAPNTAVCFILCGLAVMLLDSQFRRRWRPAQYLAMVTMMAALVALLGYAYETGQLYRVGQFIPMAVHTAMGFLLLGLSILAIRPHRGVMSVLTSDSSAGVIARRLLPATIIVPVVIGFFRLYAQKRGFDTASGIALGTVATIALLIGLLVWSAGALYRADARRQLAQNLLEVQNQLLEQAAQSEREAHETLKRAQAGLVQTEKLASLGQMVAGIAHEINNPLAFVTNNVEVLERDLSAVKQVLDLYRQGDATLAAANPELMKHLGELARRIDLDYTASNLVSLLDRSREGLRRIQQIVRDLRDFARLDEGDVLEADLNAGIESTINIIAGRAKKKDVQIRTELGMLPRVTCQPAKINQVVMNLLANGIDAAPAGGWVVIRSSAHDGQVKLDVRDNGPGVAPQVRDRIFDPFFTTKPPGEGTGLGLAISYGIVKEHGGSIELADSPQGAHFVVTLPIHAGPKPAQAKSTDRGAA